MSILLIIGAFEAAFLFLLLLGKRDKRLPDLFLSIVFALYALSLGDAYVEFYNYSHQFPYPHVLNLGWLLLLLHGPALWFYVKSLTETGFRLKSSHLLHLIPFLVFLSIHYLQFIHLSGAEKVANVRDDLFRQQPFYPISLVAIAVSTFSYNLWALLLIRNHRARIVQVYSHIEGLDLNWLRVLTIAAVAVYTVNVLLYNLDALFHFASYRMLTLTAFSFAAIYILFLGYFGLRQSHVFLSSAPRTPVTTGTGRQKTTSPGMVSPEHSSFISTLLRHMETEQPHLDPELTLAKLSASLRVKPEYLSQVLNDALQQNFFDFINRYRIEEFKHLRNRTSHQHLSILGLAYECGFNSKAAFYRAFKRYAGMSPTTWVENVSS